MTRSKDDDLEFALICQVCSEKFDHFDQYMSHIITHSTDGSCSVCGEKKASEYLLKRHILGHMQPLRNQRYGLFPCILCLEEFQSEHKLRLHAQTDHLKDCACGICGGVFDSELMLKKHMKDDHVGVKQLLWKKKKEETAPLGVSEEEMASIDDVINDVLGQTDLDISNIALDDEDEELLMDASLFGDDNEEEDNRFSCLSCGKKFDLLEDLGRHLKQTCTGANNADENRAQTVEQPSSSQDPDASQENDKDTNEDSPKIVQYSDHAYAGNPSSSQSASTKKVAGIGPKCECGKIFSSKSSIRKHRIRFNHLGAPSQPTLFDKDFDLEPEDVDESADKTVENGCTYGCEMCKYKAKSLTSLRFHIKVKHCRRRLYRCHCGVKTYNEKTMKAHATASGHRYEGSISMPVNHDDEKCKNGMSLLRKVNDAIKNEKVFKDLELQGEVFAHMCHICGINFHDEREWRKHQRTHSENFIFSCDECDKRFLTLRAKNQHDIRHQLTNPYRCRICSMDLSSLETLKLHNKYQHSDIGKAKHSCEICGRHCSSSQSLFAHRKLHFKTKPHVCEDCNAAFHLRSTLKRHKQEVHGSEKEFKCAYCPKMFHRKYHVDNHIDRVHTNKNKLKCSMCDSMYSSQSGRRRHMEEKHGVKLERRLRLCDIAPIEVTVPRRTRPTGSKSSVKPLDPTSISDAELWMDDQSTLEFLPSIDNSAADTLPLDVDSLAMLYQCGDCSMLFTEMPLLEQHIATEHTNATQLLCEGCGEGFDDINLVQFHQNCIRPTTFSV